MKKEWWFGVVVLVLFGFSMVGALTFSSGHSRLSRHSSDAIGLIEISGPLSMSESPSFFDDGGSDTLMDQLDEFAENDHIKAVIIRVNSPGGTVGYCQEVYNEILNFKARKKVPIIVSIGDLGCSGGYWISLAGDTIFANPGSMVGNIGVIVSAINVTDLANRFGVSMATYKSGPHKDMLSPFRHTDAIEAALLDDMISDIHQQFVQDVATRRKLPRDIAFQLADGRVYTGRQALGLGLVDQLGGLQPAIAYTQAVANLSGKPNIVRASGRPRFSISQFFNTQLQGWIRDAVSSAVGSSVTAKAQ